MQTYSRQFCPIQMVRIFALAVSQLNVEGNDFAEIEHDQRRPNLLQDELRLFPMEVVVHPTVK